MQSRIAKGQLDAVTDTESWKVKVARQMAAKLNLDLKLMITLDKMSILSAY